MDEFLYPVEDLGSGYACCGIQLPNLHALCAHYEAAHVLAPEEDEPRDPIESMWDHDATPCVLLDGEEAPMCPLVLRIGLSRGVNQEGLGAVDAAEEPDDAEEGADMDPIGLDDMIPEAEADEPGELQNSGPPDSEIVEGLAPELLLEICTLLALESASLDFLEDESTTEDDDEDKWSTFAYDSDPEERMESEIADNDSGHCEEPLEPSDTAVLSSEDFDVDVKRPPMSPALTPPPLDKPDSKRLGLDLVTDVHPIDPAQYRLPSPPTTPTSDTLDVLFDLLDKKAAVFKDDISGAKDGSVSKPAIPVGYLDGTDHASLVRKRVRSYEDSKRVTKRTKVDRPETAEEESMLVFRATSSRRPA